MVCAENVTGQVHVTEAPDRRNDGRGALSRPVKAYRKDAGQEKMRT